MIALALITPVSRAAPAESTVSGVVTNSAGLELQYASVEAVPRFSGESGGTVGDRPNPWIQADSHGRFRISLPAGRYKILAKDEADGCPDPVFMLNSDPAASFPEVSVQQQDISDVRVLLGKRGGILDVTLVTQSGNPVPHGKVTIRDARNSDAYVEVFADANGHLHFTVPSKPLLISATANGYKTTVFAGGSEITLSEGENRTVVLNLQSQ